MNGFLFGHFIELDLASAVQVIVLGETARAAQFQWNGYARNTTPALNELPIAVYPNVIACGTSTRLSLPCMFSWQ